MDLEKIYSDDRINEFNEIGLSDKKKGHFTNLIQEEENDTDGKIFYSDTFTKESYNKYEGFVYNISVEEDESYIINNVIVHNCFVDGFVGEDQDSMEGILSALRRQALILKSEGGYGFCADTMRPRGGFVEGIGNETPGAVRMLDMWDTQSAVITEGSGQKTKKEKAKVKIRKGAQMATMSCWHPDIEEFITAKQTPGRLTKFNMSVLITDKFMDAVENNKPWDLIFPDFEFNKELYDKDWDGFIDSWLSKGYPVKIYKTFENANELWNLIMQSTYNRNEPGVLFMDSINKLNNLYYCEKINATNPCVVGNTMVYVADGRGFVSIKELAEKNDDVPVFCLNEKGKMAIRTMRNPRITGYNSPIYKVKLDDGSEFRVTDNHKFRMKDGGYKEVKDLKYGDSLSISLREQGTFHEAFPTLTKNSQDYYWVKSDVNSNFKAEHRLIAEFHQNIKIKSGQVVHHKNYKSLDNSPSNLEVMNFEDHVKLHSVNMVGDKNPMRRAQTEWSEEKWQQYSKNMSEAVSGEKNGRYSGIDEMAWRDLALELTKNLSRRFSIDDWEKFCEEKNIKYTYTKWRQSKIGTIKGLAIWAALELGFDQYANEDPRMVKNLKKWSKQGYNCKIQSGGLLYIKKCEICDREFETLRREHGICSEACKSMMVSKRNSDLEFIKKCTKGQHKQKAEYKIEMRNKQLKYYSDLKFNLNREPLRKEWEEECKKNNIAYRLGKSSPFSKYEEVQKFALEYNHKIISVEADGFENVYNGTVDEFHNFFIACNETVKDNGKTKRFIINNLQCGEQILPVFGVCLLGSINLTQFVDFKKKDWDYEKLSKIIPLAIRFMDNVNDITNVPLEGQKENLKNKRRIGLGVMGYGSALMMLKMRYGSEEALKLTEKLEKFFMNSAYQASANIAKEKGAFPLFDKEKYLNGKFVKRLSKETVELIKEYGIRNSHLLSIQPTGNSSIFANVVSGGLEPVFMPVYVRTSMFPYPPEGLDIPKNVDWSNKTYDSDTTWDWIKEGDDNLLRASFNGYNWKFDRDRGLLRETVVKDYAVRFLENKNEWDQNADWAATTTQLTIAEHVDTMGIFATYVDSAISKTTNIPNDYPYEEFKNIYVSAYKTGSIKGFTTYRAGTMTEVLGAVKNKEDGEKISKIQKTTAPKRPKTLECEIHHATADGEKWIVIVGLLEGEPYEVFSFKPKSIHLPIRIKAGKLTKIKKGRYDLECDNGLIIENLSDHFETNEQEALTRLISTALRHGAEVQFVVEQLNKSEGTIISFAKAIARSLKKYVPDGNASDEICPNCNEKNTMVYQEGCVVCLNCSASKCG